MASREQQILDILRDEPLIAQQALADRLGISRAAVAGHIMQLVRKGLVLGRGYVLTEQGFVLAIGGANMDITGSTSHTIVAHDSTPGRIRCAPGGVARNVAENLARLGHNVRLISAVGADLFGTSLLESTRRAGVDVRGCLVLDDAATSTYLSIHGPDGDMALALNDMDILAHITPERLEGSLARVRHARAVLLDCNLSEPALGWIFGQAQAGAVFAEPVSAYKCRRLLPWLGQVHTLKANRLEVQALTGLPLDDDAALVRAALWLHDKGVLRVVLSLGARGVYWSERAGPRGWQAAAPVAVVNATGAGDALMAGLLHGYLQGDAFPATVAFAAACAAMTLDAPQANHVGLSVAAVQQRVQAQLGPDDTCGTCSSSSSI
ncbi:MAG: PfkB family carbohydrate kinase [Burkholderiaceae bacterium]